MSKELVKQGTNALGEVLDFTEFMGANGKFVGMEELDRSDIVLPRLKLCQNTSADGTPGKFLMNITGQEYDRVKVIFLKFSKSRIMWPEKFARNEGAECRSLDGVRKTGNGIGDGDCKTCRYAKWGAGKGQRPRCHEGYSLLGMLADTHEPFIFQVSGASMASVKNLNTATLTNGIPYFALTIDMYSEKVSNDKGTFYVVKFKLPEEGEYNNIELMREASKVLQGLNKIVLTRDAEIAEDAEVVEGTAAPVSNGAASDDIPF